MALTDFPPIPAELAGDAPPLTDAELDAYFGYVDEQASEAAVDPETVDEWLTTSEDDGVAESVAARVARWRITDDGAAEWALRKLAEAQAEQEELRLRAEDWTARITAWFTQASKRPAQLSAKMEALLELYALERRAETGTATLTLPSGVVSTREAKPAAGVEDDEAVAEWIDLRLTIPPSNAEAAGIARYRLWREAVDELDPSKPLVTRSAKVYAEPLRKLVRIEQQPTGVLEWTLSLSCEHEQIVTTDQGASEPAPPKNGEVVGCPACDDLTTIVAVSMKPLMAAVVVGPDGVAIPGATVKPGEIKASVKVR